MNQLFSIFKFQIYEHTGGKLSDLTLTINRVTAKTFLTQFKITAENEHGRDEKDVKVTLSKREFTNVATYHVCTCSHAYGISSFQCRCH